MIRSGRLISSGGLVNLDDLESSIPVLAETDIIREPSNISRRAGSAMGVLLFISSTSDLKAERQALADNLRPTYEAFLYEELGAGGVPPEDVIKKKIENSDVFIGLLPCRGS